MDAFSSYISRNILNTNTFHGFFEPIFQLFRPTTRFKALSSKVTVVSWNNKNTYTLRIKPHRKWQGFDAGQYLQLTVEKEGAYLTRCFSISCSPEEYAKTGEITLTIRAQKSGLVTPWISDHIRPGSKVYLSQAQGEFTVQPSKQKRLFIAGGSGITPILSMLKSKELKNQLNDTVLLFYVRSTSERFFIAELKALREMGLQYQFIYTSSEGRFKHSHLERFCPEFMHRDIYICGPNGMIDSVKQTCIRNGAPENRVFNEHFGISHSPIEVSEAKDQIISIEYEASKKRSQTQTNQHGKTLLEIAENDGLKPTFGCRMGVCHQCICKKKQGRVYNLKTKQISDTGEEEIQLCLSTPIEDLTLEL